MPIVKYIGPMNTQFGVTIDHRIYDVDPAQQRELALPDDREVALLLEREPDLWEVVNARQEVPAVIDTQDSSRSKRGKPSDAESASHGTE